MYKNYDDNGIQTMTTQKNVQNIMGSISYSHGSSERLHTRIDISVGLSKEEIKAFQIKQVLIQSTSLCKTFIKE